jgi:hypothetical protein
MQTAGGTATAVKVGMLGLGVEALHAGLHLSVRAGSS